MSVAAAVVAELAVVEPAELAAGELVVTEVVVVAAGELQEFRFGQM